MEFKKYEIGNIVTHKYGNVAIVTKCDKYDSPINICCLSNDFGHTEAIWQCSTDNIRLATMEEYQNCIDEYINRQIGENFKNFNEFNDYEQKNIKKKYYLEFIQKKIVNTLEIIS